MKLYYDQWLDELAYVTPDNKIIIVVGVDEEEDFESHVSYVQGYTVESRPERFEYIGAL